MRGLTYCTHLYGLGHLKLIMLLNEGLLKFSDVDFIQGGITKEMTLDHPHFRHIHLPAFDPNLFSAEQTKLYLKTRLSQASKQLNLAKPYDYFIIENIPFSKLFFWPEVYALIHHLKKVNPKVLICCSHRGFHRDIREKLSADVYKSLLKTERQTVGIIRKFFDVVFVHSDPSIIKLDETFDHINLISDKLIYTGFLEKKSALVSKPKREKRILVSIGSGLDKNDLFLSILEIASELPEYQFLFVLGPLFPPEKRRQIEKIMNEKKLTNILLTNFVHEFEEELLKSSLAITLGGISVINMYSTRTPGIAFPSKDIVEQNFLTRKFHEQGLVNYGTPEDMAPSRLLSLIKKALSTPYPEEKCTLNMDGVENTSLLIQKLIAQKRKA